MTARSRLEDGVTLTVEKKRVRRLLTLLNLFPASYTWQNFGVRRPAVGRRNIGQIPPLEFLCFAEAAWKITSLKIIRSTTVAFRLRLFPQGRDKQKEERGNDGNDRRNL